MELWLVIDLKIQKKAKNFIERLYNLGAEEVMVVHVKIYKDDDFIGTDTLKLKLPSDREKRTKILKIVNNESRREVLINKKSEEEKDTGQEFTGFWWD